MIHTFYYLIVTKKIDTIINLKDYEMYSYILLLYYLIVKINLIVTKKIKNQTNIFIKFKRLRNVFYLKEIIVFIFSN